MQHVLQLLEAAHCIDSYSQLGCTGKALKIPCSVMPHFLYSDPVSFHAAHKLCMTQQHLNNLTVSRPLHLLPGIQIVITSRKIHGFP